MSVRAFRPLLQHATARPAVCLRTPLNHRLFHQLRTNRPQSFSSISKTHRTQTQGSKSRVRHASSLSSSRYWIYMLKKNPVLATIAISGLIVSIPLLAWSVYIYVIAYRELSNYPEDVALKIKRGIFFTENPDAFDPPRAIKAYIEALQLAHKNKMDPLSDEVLQIRLLLSRTLGKAGNAQEAATVCEYAKKDILNALDEIKDIPGTEKRRTQLLLASCTFSLQAASMYGHPNLADDVKVEENLVWAVETSIREYQRRQRDKVDEEVEGKWMTPDEMGNQYEELATYYEKDDNFYFAAQLYLQALMIKPVKDCHTVILMNNLAAAVVQQIPVAEPGTKPPTRQELRESGRSWAHRAIRLAETIEPPYRTPECDHGCVAATVNIAEFDAMDGKVAAARERYEEAASLAHAIRYQEGLVEAEEGLKRLNSGKPVLTPSEKRNTLRNWLANLPGLK